MTHPGPKSHAERFQATVLARAQADLNLTEAQVEQLRTIAAEETNWLLAEQKRHRDAKRKADYRIRKGA